MDAEEHRVASSDTTQTICQPIDVDREARLEAENMRTELQTACEYYDLALADAQPGAMVHGCLLDLMLTRLYDTAPEASKTKWRVLSGAPTEPPRTDPGNNWIKPIWYAVHFVLLVYEEKGFVVYDSAPGYANHDRDQAVKCITRNQPYTVRNTGPQHLNDCAFHTAASAARLLGVRVPLPVTDLRGYFMRPIIAAMREARNAIAQVLLPSYKEHVKRHNRQQQQTWVPPESMYEPSPPRQETDTGEHEPLVAVCGVVRKLLRLWVVLGNEGVHRHLPCGGALRPVIAQQP